MPLVGMLFDKVKPTMTSFLKPLVQEVINYINMVGCTY